MTRVLGRLVPAKLKGLGVNFAVLMGAVVLGLAATAYMLANQSTTAPWAERVAYSVDFREAFAIAPRAGQEVRIAGVEVGEIVGAEVTEAGARVHVALRPEHATVHQDATARLRPKTVLNEIYLALEPGTPGSPELDPGGVIPGSQTVTGVQLDQALADIDPDAREALEALLVTLDEVLPGRADDVVALIASVEDIAEDVHPLAEVLAEREDLLSDLVGDLSVVAASLGTRDRAIAELVSSAGETLEVLGARESELAEALRLLPDVLETGTSSLTRVEALTGDLDPILADLGDGASDLGPALREVAELAERARPLARQARPLVGDLAELSGDLRTGAPDLRVGMAGIRPALGQLDPMTAALLDYLPDLKRFIIQTNEATSVEDANAPALRGPASFSPETVGVPWPEELVSDPGIRDLLDALEGQS